eukprot:g9092.t1
MMSAAPRSTGQATLITGLLGSGKTWSLTSQLLQAAASNSSSSSSSEPPLASWAGPAGSSGSLLALSRQADCAALQQRVDLERPLGCAKCNVVTFPSLVRTIVNDFGPTVGSYTPADPPSALDRSGLSVFLHRNLDALPLGRYRPLHDPGEAVRPLLDLFFGLAHCGLSPEDYLRYVETLETELLEATPAGGAPATAADDEAAAAVRARRRVQLEAEGWRAHVAGERDKANSYEAFARLKRREGVVDYSDQLLLARRVLRESAAARAALSLRLSHVYVDDLQDYSPLMVDVLSGLVAPGVGITAAADPSLAAMSARGGPAVMGAQSLTAVSRFKAAFPGATEVELAGKHHSSGAIQVAMRALGPRSAPVGAKEKRTKKAKKKPAGADAKAAVTSPVTDAAAPAAAAAAAAAAASSPEAVPTSSPAVAEETASSAATVTDGGGRLTCLTFQKEEDEVRALARRIQGLIDEGLSPGDIGVAAIGSRGVVDRLVAALSAAGVAAVEGPIRFSGVFDHETPRVLMSFLRCLVHPSESAPLLHLLMACPAYALPGGELSAALEEHLSRYVPLRSFLRDIQLGEESREAGQTGAGVSAGARKVAGRLLSDVDSFAEASKRKGVREVMRDFLRHTGQLERLEEPTTAEEEQEGHAVGELFEFAARAEKQAGGDNVALVEPILRLFRRHGARFTDSSRFDHDETTTITDDKTHTDGGQWASGTPSGGHSVRVFNPEKDWRFAETRMFDTVFVPFCSRARLPGNLRTARLPVPGPFRGAPEPRDSASVRSEADHSRACHENRARAVLYAALGAARREVRLSVSARVSRGKMHLNPSPFLFEILGVHAPREWKTAAVRSKEEEEEEVLGVVERFERAVSGDADAEAARPSEVRGARGINAGASVSVPSSPPPVPLRLSFSSISALGACPHSYYLGHVLKVSPPPNPRMVYGRAMHEGVATFLRGVASAGGGGGGSGGGGPPPTLEAVVEEFNSQLSGCAFESAAQVRTLREAGVAGLESFMSRLTSGGGEGDAADSARAMRQQRQQQPRQLLVERKFMVKVPEADVVLSGIFDRVDIAPPPPPTSEANERGAEQEASSSHSSLCITDYKSNVGEKDPTHMVRNNLQLQVYALAAERLFGTFPTELAIESIEDGRRGVAVPSTADAEVALEAISAAAAVVRAGDFGATPSFQACSFCGFKNMCRHSAVTSAAL